MARRTDAPRISLLQSRRRIPLKEKVSYCWISDVHAYQIPDTTVSVLSIDEYIYERNGRDNVRLTSLLGTWPTAGLYNVLSIGRVCYIAEDIR